MSLVLFIYEHHGKVSLHRASSSPLPCLLSPFALYTIVATPGSFLNSHAAGHTKPNTPTTMKVQPAARIVPLLPTESAMPTRTETTG